MENSVIKYEGIIIFMIVFILVWKREVSNINEQIESHSFALNDLYFSVLNLLIYTFIITLIIRLVIGLTNLLLITIFFTKNMPIPFNFSSLIFIITSYQSVFISILIVFLVISIYITFGNISQSESGQRPSLGQELLKAECTNIMIISIIVMFVSLGILHIS